MKFKIKNNNNSIGSLIRCIVTEKYNLNFETKMTTIGDTTDDNMEPYSIDNRFFQKKLFEIVFSESGEIGNIDDYLNIEIYYQDNEFLNVPLFSKNTIRQAILKYNSENTPADSSTSMLYYIFNNIEKNDT